MIVFDTNILIDLESDQEEISSLLSQMGVSDQNIAITSFTYSEFYYGSLDKSGEIQRKVLKKLDLFDLLNTTKESSVLHAILRKDRERSGKPIPDLDLLIASVVMAHGATLVTRDTHFKEIEGLSVVVI